MNLADELPIRRIAVDPIGRARPDIAFGVDTKAVRHTRTDFSEHPTICEAPAIDDVDRLEQFFFTG